MPPRPVSTKSKTVAVAEKAVCEITGREIKYPQPFATVLEPITVERAMELLGWEFEADEKFGHDYLFTDTSGVKIRCSNNVNNRPLYGPNLASLKQDIINKKWKFNGETIIIGRTGLVLNGQHTLIAVVLAEQERVGSDKDRHALLWSGPVEIVKAVVYGVSEDDETINTMDTCKPRTLMDVIFRSSLFSEYEDSPGDRKIVSRMTDFAVRTLWERTWSGDVNGWTPRRTHAESVSFIERHPTILKAVKHIHTENVKGAIAKFISTGYASAMLYLMAGSATDDEEYYMAQYRDEKLMDFSLWEKACEFWTLMAKGSERLMEVRHAVAGLSDPETGAGASIKQKMAIIANAWVEFSGNHGREDSVDPTKEGCQLVLSDPNDFGARDVLVWPLFGGIDRGYQDKSKKKKDKTGSGENEYADGEDDNPEEEELEEGDDGNEGEIEDVKPVMTAPKTTPKKASGGVDPEVVKAKLADLKKRTGNRVLIIRNDTGCVMWEKDAELYGKLMDKKVKNNIVTGLMQVQFKFEELKDVMAKIFKAGQKPSICYPSGNDYEIVNIAEDGTETRVVTYAPAKPGKINRR